METQVFQTHTLKQWVFGVGGTHKMLTWFGAQPPLADYFPGGSSELSSCSEGNNKDTSPPNRFHCSRALNEAEPPVLPVLTEPTALRLAGWHHGGWRRHHAPWHHGRWHHAGWHHGGRWHHAGWHHGGRWHHAGWHHGRWHHAGWHHGGRRWHHAGWHRGGRHGVALTGRKSGQTPPCFILESQHPRDKLMDRPPNSLEKAEWKGQTP